MSDESRTLPASPQRREEALARGEAPCTPEVGGVLVALALGALLRQMPVNLPRSFARLAGLWSAETFRGLASGRLDLSALAPPDALPPGFAVLAMVPVCLALTLWMQKGFRIFPERVMPDPSRLLPRAPWGSGEVGVSGVRGLARVALGAYVALRLFGARTPWSMLDLTGRLATLAIEVAALWGALAVADWLWRRHRFEASIMMTPAEARAENRSSEGDPRVKAEIRARMEAAHAGGPSRRALLREGDVVALVTVYEDANRAPVVQVAARGAQGERLVAGSGRLSVPVHFVPGVRGLAGMRPGSALPDDLGDAVARLRQRMFPPRGGEAA